MQNYIRSDQSTLYSMNSLFSQFVNKFGGAWLEVSQTMWAICGSLFGGVLEGFGGMSDHYSDPKKAVKKTNLLGTTGYHFELAM